MIRRSGLAVALGAALLAAGCASWGLSPTPKEVEAGRGLKFGLDIAPDRVSHAPSHGIGLDAFPGEVASGENPGTGLSPFPYAGQPLPEETAAEPEPAPAAAPKKAPPVQEPVERPAAKTPEPPRPAPRLALRFRKDDANRLRVKHEMKQELPALGGTQDTTTRSEFVISQSVTGVGDAGRGSVRNTIDAFKFELESPMMTLGFDSADPGTVEDFRDNVIAQQVGLVPLADLVGATFQVDQGTNGTVEKVEGLPQAGRNLGLNPDSFMGVAAAFPEAPVVVGLDWSVEKTVQGAMGGRELKTTGRLEVTAWDPASGIAEITMTATVTLSDAPEGSEDPAAMGGVTNLRLKKGEVSGKSTYDLGQGVRTSSESSAEMVFEFSHPMLGDGVEQLMFVKSSTERLP